MNELLRLKAASETAQKILQRYPDYSKAPPEYLAAVSAFLAGLTPEEQALIADLKTGVTARTKYLPTIADMAEILNEHRAVHEQFRPAHTVYRRFSNEPGPWDEETDYERKQRVVREALGYNPGDYVGKTKWAFEPKLKPTTDSKPISRELRQLLAEDDWPYFQSADDPLMRRTAG